ncbi:cytochrome c biogenesis protein CcsA [Anaerolineales bacterium HSG25]|nr:cytochrome c biogenesis protein CcsA [Anaerolineales bacterium HSG25]
MTTNTLPSQQSKTETSAFSWGAAFTIFTGFIMLTALYVALVWAPEAVNLASPVERYAQRIFYFHVPAAWVGFLAFIFSALFSVIYLIKRQQKWDALALSSVEVGLAFFTMVMLSGPIWAKPTWNVWWTWDPRLTISTICWLLYIGYIMLRGAIDNPEREARFAAVFAIISSLSIPLNWMAIRWWRTIHPAVLSPGNNSGGEGGFGMSPDIRNALIFCTVAFTIFYINLMYHRVKLEMIKHRVESLKQDVLYQ